MATTPTQNSVPSESPIDLKFNAGKIDEYVTSMGWTYTDRFGKKHYTIEGNNYLAKQAMAAFGYVILTGKTFTTGATINNPNEVLLNTADGEYYKWTGSFASGPKVVPENSTPTSTGGIGPGLWIGVGDASLRAALAASTGSTLIGHEGHTVGQYLDGVGKMVLPGDDLKAALESAGENETIMVVGDVSLTKSVTLTKAVSIDCSKGRVIWSGTGSCIRYIPPVLQTYTDPITFIGGQNSAQFPIGHTVKVGQLLCCYSNERRAGASLGDYYRGQYLFVRKVTGQQVEFYPSVLEGFTSNKIEVRKPTSNMQHYFRLKQVTPVGTPGGVILDMPFSLNCSGYVELDCNRDPNVGFGIGGHNHNFTFNIQGITNGATGYNVMGYGVGATGTRMHFEGTGSNCRHLTEIPDGSILSADIHFDINATKEVGNPLYLYIAGAHCNVLGWSLSGRISGSGGMVQDRSGTCHFHNLHFDCPDDGYGDGYYCIGVSELYPSQTLIENVTMTVSGLKRKTLIEWDIKGQSTQNGLLRIRDCITKGRARIIKLRDTGAGATTHTYRLRIEGCSGEAASIHNRDIANSNVYLELYNNTWSTYGLDSFPDYMAGSDSTGCKIYDVHSADNVFDDTNTSGIFSFDGYMDEIRFSSQADKNTAKPFIKLTPSYLGSIGRLDINGLNTMGQMTLTPLEETVYKDIGQIRFCRIGVDNINPVNVGLSWPIIYTGNSFKTTFDATLVSTKRPQAGNVNISGKALNWNGTNIAV
ncbi:tail fiber/spike domain-containing protein [Enterobacter kobei]|uniref:tail fiber/spike domain-containing protein n=1 Tax=Enterobacter kobei TaxID=208224 RepID=UPI00403F9986